MLYVGVQFSCEEYMGPSWATSDASDCDVNNYNSHQWVYDSQNSASQLSCSRALSATRVVLHLLYRLRFPAIVFHLSNPNIVYVDVPVHVAATFIGMNTSRQKWHLFIVDLANGTAQTISSRTFTGYRWSHDQQAVRKHTESALSHLLIESPRNIWVLHECLRRPFALSIKKIETLFLRDRTALQVFQRLCMSWIFIIVEILSLLRHGTLST